MPGADAAIDQETLETALSSIAWLQSQQAEIQELPQQLQETQQQLAALIESLPASISSSIAAAESRQLDSLQTQITQQIEQAQNWKDTEAAMADLRCQVEQFQHLPGMLQESQRQMQHAQD